jgi:putative membrane protein
MSPYRLVTLGVVLILFGSAASASAKADQAFLKDAIQGNLGEVTLGQLAQKNGNSEGVRSFGQMLVQDHSASNEKATELARKENVTPPTEPKPEAKAEQNKLSKLSGDAFDKEFVTYMVKDHEKDIKEFEKQAKGSDMVASFAKDTLPTLQKHLKTAQSLASGKSVQE